MSGNFHEPKRTNEELRKFAKQLREKLGIAKDNVVDIVAILRFGRSIPTVEGPKKVVIEIVPDRNLGTREAETTVLAEKILIRVRSSLWNAAIRVPEDEDELKRHRRAKFTLTHELFHGVLCHGRGQVTLARHADKSNTEQKGRVYGTLKFVERQADYAAACFLIPLDLVDQDADVSWIQTTFDVNFLTAKQAFDEIEAAKKSPKIVGELQKLVEELRAPLPPQCKPAFSKAKNLADDIANSNREATSASLRGLGCPNCAYGRSNSVGGNRFACEACKVVGDSYQDGDPLIDF